MRQHRWGTNKTISYQEIIMSKTKKSYIEADERKSDIIKSMFENTDRAVGRMYGYSHNVINRYRKSDNFIRLLKEAKNKYEKKKTKQDRGKINQDKKQDRPIVNAGMNAIERLDRAAKVAETVMAQSVAEREWLLTLRAIDTLSKPLMILAKIEHDIRQYDNEHKEISEDLYELFKIAQIAERKD